MKFDHVGIDADTIITAQTEGLFGELPVLYQTWDYEGIEGASYIFCNEDIATIALDNLIADIKKSPVMNDPEGSITTSVNDRYTFVNFNFKAESE